ncbi:arylamine N-acetyltransferase family protein [Marinomonas balearica]|uniref:N-hydroxyarylamine O-acetyltransferase n=1 Tax=Marinomonas balearica TaxID=491947 RepID=A0A4R6MBK9_9GAMM|nr:arylamine N-acetyltransferase [Marinomonas balearica]TDO98991.1 N-hydroxyarylamine O-acetyltransferase [Marinomonas balearica]
MTEFKFNASDYLKRIEMSKKVLPTLESLHDLHAAQIFSIPFENFDICLGNGVHLSPNHIFDKLVHKKRGGYCYELNGLMLMALKFYGFDAKAALARVHLSGAASGRNHQFTVVTLNNEQWILDAGFGSNTPIAPLPLVLNKVLTIKHKTYRYVERELVGIMYQTWVNGEWMDLYSFDLGYVCQGDIDYANYYTSTHPNSFFFSSRVAVQPFSNGMYSLHNFTLKKIEGNSTQVIELPPGEPYMKALEDYFGIALEVPYDRLRGISVD